MSQTCNEGVLTIVGEDLALLVAGGLVLTACRGENWRLAQDRNIEASILMLKKSHREQLTGQGRRWYGPSG